MTDEPFETATVESVGASSMPDSNARRIRRRRASASTDSRSRRIAAGALVVLSLVVLVLFDERPSDKTVTAPTLGEAVVLPSDDVVSSAWYCPGGVPGNANAITATTDDDESQIEPLRDLVLITNTTERDASVRVTAFSSLAEPVSRPVAVSAGESLSVPVAELSNGPDVAVMVETFVSGIVVEEQVGAPDRDDVAVGPCATETSSTWYFAAGSTVRDSTMWLSLFNPFSQDAVLDITVVTNDTIRRPSELQSLVVPARARRSVFVNDAADRKRVVSLIIESSAGSRVIAQQTTVHRGAQRRFGVSSTIGAVTTGSRFTFAGGSARPDTTRLVYILNPGPVSTDVDVLLAAQGATPTTIRVAPESVEVVNISELAPPDSQYAVIVEATAGFDASRGRGVVVEDFEGYRIERGRRSVFGVAGGIGLVAPAREWRFAVSRIDADTRGRAIVYNPNDSTVTVDIAYVLDGELVRPEALQGVEVEGSSPRSIGLDIDVDERVGLIVTSSRPVYVERFLVREESVTRSTGVPRR